MNQQNLKVWLNGLWNEVYDQCEGALTKEPEGRDGRVQMCCLGVGSAKAGIERVSVQLEPDKFADHDEFRELVDNGNWNEGEFITGFVGKASVGSVVTVQGRGVVTELQPREFNEWLGVPFGTLQLGEQLMARDSGTRYLIPLHELNDGGFTFPQIADLINHFGLSVDGLPQ